MLGNMKYLTSARTSVALALLVLCGMLFASHATVHAFPYPNYPAPVFADGEVCDTSKPDSYCNDPALDCDPVSGGDCDLYKKYINPFINILTALVGIAVTIGIIWGGIKYASAGSDPSAVAKARKLIRNAIFTLVIYLLLWQMINWLQPGGL
jgi:Type IV secretion system pilin